MTIKARLAKAASKIFTTRGERFPCFPAVYQMSGCVSVT